MWHEGLTLNLVAWILNALALATGAALGARALLDPRWASRLVRLKPDESRPGGAAEFRATYGGLLLGMHGVSLLVTVHWILFGQEVIGAFATGAAMVLAAGWFGAAFGRAVSIWRDDVRTKFNILSAAFEALVGMMLAAPWLVWFLTINSP
ncbi:MAG TPA: hypothetical protein VG841_15740 [Caulobacterales bacterium]|nr:hypothetical protein [Caulobacterales bacterium]